MSGKMQMWKNIFDNVGDYKKRPWIHMFCTGVPIIDTWNEYEDHRYRKENGCLRVGCREPGDHCGEDCRLLEVDDEAE